MHATHQFFLTKRSLYLLVVDARLGQEENRIEYWLKIIQSFGGDSPVLIVGNKIDQHPLDVDRTGLRRKYPPIVDIVETSAATGAGLDDLRRVIAEKVDALPHVHDLLPESWFEIKTLLEGLGKSKNFITHDGYLGLCAEKSVASPADQHTLIGFLHDLGVVIHFQDDPRLEALGILNPQWVTNGVYKILNSHLLFQQHGELTRVMLDAILDSPEYPSTKKMFIVDMMRKFELCYDIEPETKFLVPDLLPKDEPYTGEWRGALGFQYHYNVLPSSIVSRFIVRMNTFIYRTVWRSGVVLKRGGNTALVKADSEERRICIWVHGDEHTRRDLLAVLCAEFEAIHRSIAKIEAREKVPHPEYEALMFDYQELLQFERDGISEVPKLLDGKSIKVNVSEMLDGVSPSNVRRKSQASSYVEISGPVEKLIVRPPAMEEKRVGQIHRSNGGRTARSPWASGLFYLFACLVVIATLGMLARALPWYSLPVVLVAAVILVPVIGALQLRQDQGLSEKGFLELTKLSLSQLPVIGQAIRKQ
jgi:internalin A